MLLKIKSLLLEKNYVIACCCRECVEPLKRITNVLYIDTDIGDDNTLRGLRALALSIREGYCYAEMFLGDIDAEKAEEIALTALAIVKLSKLFKNPNPVEASTQYS